MKTSRSRFMRRSLLLATIGVLVAVLTACTGRGGGQLPADNLMFKGPASFGFTFSCEDSGGLNPRPGQLRIQLSYTDHGSNPLGSGFSIHGIVDTIDPVLESELCSGQEPAPGGKLIFLGRYYLTSSAPSGFPTTCPTRETTTSPLCRFEVIVQDNDRNRAPSMGDSFSIKLSTVTSVTNDDGSFITEFPATVPYARAGLLSSGNITVD